ncbi:TatD family hydrolase [Candidatus Daviesbacteria bacterium]|nr:TatD family hydrolase [Candidatus Daviesbacteria bacterium]
MLIDTHAHLYWDSYKDDLDEVIKRSVDAGVTTIINVGVDVEKSQIALQQVQGKLATMPGFSAYSTIGIHPHESIKYPNAVSIHKDMERLEQIYLSSTSKVVAVGECGLDYLPSSLSIDQQKDSQRKLFQAQIDLAKKLNLPLIVHCRDDRSQNPQTSEAWEEIINMTQDHFGIFHCYSGLPQITDYILQTTKFLVSFAGTLTYPKNDYLREAVKILPLGRIVLETDCPFLPPQSKRGQRNEPVNVLEIAQLIAEEKGISLKEIGIQTTENVKKLLKLN